MTEEVDYKIQGNGALGFNNWIGMEPGFIEKDQV